MQDFRYDIALSHFPKFGPRSIKHLYEHFDHAKDAFFANEIGLISAGIDPATAKQFQYFKEELDVDQLFRDVERAGLSLVTPQDASYPIALKTIFDPPQLLYVQGKLPNPHAPHLSVVGSRNCSAYGERITKELVKGCAEAGVVIVSGLAYGIDSHAHQAAVEAGGATVAVLACGHNRITGRAQYIAQHIIASGGAIISEFPLGTPALPFHHPIRNRIISGMSRATLVVEAAIKSGSLITAKSAIDQNRDVFAVPGPVDSITSEGTNQMLKDGALTATNSADLLQYFAIAPSKEHKDARVQPTLSKNGSVILNLLSRQPIHIDEITRKTGLGSVVVAQELSNLELEGLTKQIGGMYYILS